MSGLLFVTATSADHKLINRLLLHLRDIEFGSGDRFHIVTTKDASELQLENDERFVKSTIPPVPQDISNNNAWRGAKLEEIEAYALELSRSDTRTVSSSIYLVLDDEGVRDRRVVLGERAYDDDEDKLTDVFQKTRVPWDEAYTVWCNLDIANMGFEDYCDEGAGADENGWWQYNEEDGGADITSDENKAKRDEEIQKLEKQGRA
ncbi:hypothetical protein F4778DRAFT_86392 [Xylariomycetidae sp. FL2044]|nr:hypothetical protein F4778DRAFT_86392 [Xylariomycetidae sp. FL2044]